MTARAFLVTASLLSLASVAACSAASVPHEEESGNSDQDLTASGGTTRLVYLGSSSFLRQCAGPTHTLGCGRPLSSVPDSTPYFSAPRSWPRTTCDDFYTFRLGNRCVEAQRLEISDTRNLMEGNPGLFDGLGLSHSDGTHCSGSGEANGVTVTAGRHCNAAGTAGTAPSNGAKSGGDTSGTGSKTPLDTDAGPGTGTGKGGSGGEDDGSGEEDDGSGNAGDDDPPAK